MSPRSPFLSSVSLAVALFATTAAAGAAPPPARAHEATAVLAGGCFWGMEDVFERLTGVRDVVVGYAGGNAATARYEIVSTGLTAHAESVKITYDPAVISYGKLLDVYFRVAHDPTQRDRQGPDDGKQYRSEIFYTTDAQKRDAQAKIAQLEREKAFATPIVTIVAPETTFFAAEAYHQHFADKNPSFPYIVAVDEPKVADLRAKFPGLLKKSAT